MNELQKNFKIQMKDIEIGANHENKNDFGKFGDDSYYKRFFISNKNKSNFSIVPIIILIAIAVFFIFSKLK